MYNIDFLPQLEQSRKYLFGSGAPREVSDNLHAKYMPPSAAKIIECKEDTNGEWVPVPASLEKRVADSEGK